MSKRRIELDIHCAKCAVVKTYNPPLVAGGREMQNAVIERYLRRHGWGGPSPEFLLCPACVRKDVSD